MKAIMTLAEYAKTVDRTVLEEIAVRFWTERRNEQNIAKAKALRQLSLR